MSVQRQKSDAETDKIVCRVNSPGGYYARILASHNRNDEISVDLDFISSPQVLGSDGMDSYLDFCMAVRDLLRYAEAIASIRGY